MKLKWFSLSAVHLLKFFEHLGKPSDPSEFLGMLGGGNLQEADMTRNLCPPPLVSFFCFSVRPAIHSGKYIFLMYITWVLSSWSAQSREPPGSWWDEEVLPLPPYLFLSLFRAAKIAEKIFSQYILLEFWVAGVLGVGDLKEADVISSLHADAR